jgi:hypothetical protein
MSRAIDSLSVTTRDAGVGSLEYWYLVSVLLP